MMVVECIYEPRGDYGLEGYQLGDRYMAEWVPAGSGNPAYYRVWPVPGQSYETCSVRAFKRCFKEVP